MPLTDVAAQSLSGIFELLRGQRDGADADGKAGKQPLGERTPAAADFQDIFAAIEFQKISDGIKFGFLRRFQRVDAGFGALSLIRRSQFPDEGRKLI